MVKRDLTKFKNTIGAAFWANRDALLAVKSADEAIVLVKKIFVEKNINTQKSREIIFKLTYRNMKPTAVLLYLNNILMNSKAMGVI